MNKKTNFSYSKCCHPSGFTLAEVMMVLVILGVVAAITIPSTINNYRKTELITRLKMAYSLLNNVVGQSEAFNGHVSTWDFSKEGGRADAESFANTYLTPYLNISSVCQNNNDSPKCFSNRNKIYTFFNEEAGKHANDSYMFRVKNGMSFAIATGMDQDKKNKIKIYVDINGPDKGHSVIGEDVFVFQITKDGLAPYAHWHVTTYKEQNPDTILGRGECLTGGYSNGSQATGAPGTSCALYIISNGWKLPNDYNPYNINKSEYAACYNYRFAGIQGCNCVNYEDMLHHRELHCGDRGEITVYYDEENEKWVKR